MNYKKQEIWLVVFKEDAMSQVFYFLSNNLSVSNLSFHFHMVFRRSMT